MTPARVLWLGIAGWGLLTWQPWPWWLVLCVVVLTQREAIFDDGGLARHPEA